MKNGLYKKFFVLIASCALWHIEAQQDAVLVIGYNNTRIYDVKKIKDIAKEHFNATTVLCKKSPVSDDYNAADYVIDTGLEAQIQHAQHVINECKKWSLNPIAILPFSDPGTQLGALLAHTLGLPGNDLDTVRAGIDKSFFREQEKKALIKPKYYRPLFSKVISCKQELQEAYNQCPQGIFLKPCQEGNNRGCTHVRSLQDCERAWEFVEKYKAGGILAEEFVENAQEYSCDRAGIISWVTLKDTLISRSGKYRGEIQYIVPAPEDEQATAQKLAVGKFMADISGSTVGAYHNEMFFKNNEISAIEPNLRPAGGHLWDCAQLAFENFNPWIYWIYTMAGKELPHIALKRKCYVGFRFIYALQDGTIVSLPTLQQQKHNSSDLVELGWLKKINDSVSSDVKDNADFVGYIIARDTDSVALNTTLHEVAEQLAHNLGIKIENIH